MRGYWFKSQISHQFMLHSCLEECITIKGGPHPIRCSGQLGTNLQTKMTAGNKYKASHSNTKYKRKQKDI